MMERYTSQQRLELLKFTNEIRSQRPQRCERYVQFMVVIIVLADQQLSV